MIRPFPYRSHMAYSTEKSIQILERTPNVLRALLSGLSEDWTGSNEGEGTWSPYDVVGHLIHGEKTDWVPRAEIILSEHADKTFEPFDRFAQMKSDRTKPMAALLDEFAALRRENLERLRSFNITPEQLGKTGIHPALGEVTLSQLLATWVVHDLGHIAQISRVMAKQYNSEVGPWRAFLRVLE